MEGSGRDSLVAIILTMDPVMFGLILTIAALVAIAILALTPRRRTWLRIAGSFLAYWVILIILLLLFVQGALGRSLMTVECVPFEAQKFGMLVQTAFSWAL
jgi:hypothetical protein